jgi:predicted transcriptional regulator
MLKDMRKSKLRYYEDIISVLYNKAKTIDEIAFNLNMDCLALQVKLDFLLENSLVEERQNNMVRVFALTKRGLAILKTITISKQLDKLRNTITKMDKTIRTVHASSENGFKRTNILD